jgi:hypothetical protein
MIVNLIGKSVKNKFVELIIMFSVVHFTKNLNFFRPKFMDKTRCTNYGRLMAFTPLP